MVGSIGRTCGTMPGPVTCELVARDTVWRIGGESMRVQAGALSTGGRFWIERQRGAAFGAEFLELLSIFGEESIPPHRLDQELQAVGLLVLVVAELMKHPHDRFGSVKDLSRPAVTRERAPPTSP